MLRRIVLYGLILPLLLIAMSAAAAFGQNLTFSPGVLQLIAGDPTGQNPRSGPAYNGPASGWVLNQPGNIAFDSSGNLYVIESNQAIVRVVAASSNPIPVLPGVTVQAGHVYTVAGTTNFDTGSIPCAGGADVQGNGCPATVAAVPYDTGIAVDKNGNVYIADMEYNQIRVVYGGKGSLPGITSPKAGYIYALTNQANIRDYPETGYNGPAVNAVVEYPLALAVDGNGNIFFLNNNDASLDMIYAGGTLPSNFFPSGATPVVGYMYLLGDGNGDTCTNICDGMPIGEANLGYPQAIAIDTSGNIYLSDNFNSEFRGIYIAGKMPGVSSPTPGNIYAVAGNGDSGTTVSGSQAQATPVNFPYSGGGIAFDAGGSIYFSAQDYVGGFGTVYKIDPTGVLTFVYGGNAFCSAPSDKYDDGCVATAFNQASLGGVAVDSTGDLYLSDKNSSLITESVGSTTVLDFSGVAGIPGQNQSVYVSNSGTQPLQLSNVALTAPFSQVAIGTSDCNSSTSLASGQGCVISVNYAPNAVGTQTGSLTIGSNALNATSGSNAALLSGTAIKATSSAQLVVTPSIPVKANVGQTVTLTATVVPQVQDTLTPTGTVAFMNGSTQLGTANVANGVASFAANGLAAGTYALTAVYGGDSNFLTSTSSPATVVVSTTPVAVVTVASSASTSVSGQSVTLTANVAAYAGGGTPTGTVTFQDEANPLPNGTVTLNGGVATFTTTALPTGNNQVVALYSGDSQFGANASAPTLVMVTAAGTLQFTPGVISLVSGSYFTKSTNGPSNGTQATLAQYPTNGLRQVAVDSYGNTYVPGGGLDHLWVTASGKGPIPGVTSPVAGTLYSLGAGTQCSNSATAACGDGGPLSQASFNSLNAIAVDGLNNIYVSDNGTVRKISATTGNISTIAGTWAKSGYSGDGGYATAAKVNVQALYADVNGNVYIADSADLLIRRVDGQTGVITTVAGTTTGATSGGNGCNTLPCGDGGLATSAQLIGPQGIFVDHSNNIFFTDSGYTAAVSGLARVVRKVDGTTGLISILAGQYKKTSCGSEAYETPCGDGGPATSAILTATAGIAGDSAGDVYLTDSLLATVREVNAQTGIITTVVGNASTEGQNQVVFGANPLNWCKTAPCGDGGPATTALLTNPVAVTLDQQGNIYVLDSATYTVRMVSGAASAIAYGSQNLGTTTTQAVTVNNIGSTPLTFSALSVPMPNFDQELTGNGDCAATTSLAAGASCQLNLSFFPTATGALTGTLSITSNATNATGGQNTIALSGTGIGLGGTQSQSITFQPVPAGLVYGARPILLSASSDATRANSSDSIVYLATGPATISGSTLKILGAGTVKVTAYQFGDSQYAAAVPVPQTFTVAPATLTIQATAGSASIIAGQPIPALSFTATGFANSDTQSLLNGLPALAVVDALGNTHAVGSTPLSGTYTITIQQGTLALSAAAAANYQLVFVNGTLSVTGATPQQLTLPALGNITYGAAPIALAATSSSGLPVSYSVQGPANVVGNLLTVTGAGAVAVTANQSGNAQYSAATPLTVAFNVSKAALNVTAANVSVAQGSPLPTLTYTLSGFVDGDSQAVVTGTPLLTTTASSSSPLGQYPITVAAGSLTAMNYSFSPVQGTLTIVTPTTQTITFPAIAGVTYGATPVTLNATASSGLGVSYAVTGPASLSGNVLSITGAGTVTVTANQVGNATYGPATAVMQSFSVSQAVLTIAANNATRVNDTQNPTFTYTVSGLVNGDAQGSAISGTPQLATVATTSSPVGTYPITTAIGSLKSANYSFNLVPATLTITSGGPVADFTLTATPQTLSVAQGHTVQATITLSPVNYYQGLVNLSCGSLPANITCTFSPATLAPDGTNNPVSGTITLSTDSSSAVIGQVRTTKNGAVSATFLYLPAGIAGLLLMLRRRQYAKQVGHWALLLLLFAGAAGLTACGSSAGTGNSTLAQTGTSVITLKAADSSNGPTHTINLGITVK